MLGLAAANKALSANHSYWTPGLKVGAPRFHGDDKQEKQAISELEEAPASASEPPVAHQPKKHSKSREQLTSLMESMHGDAGDTVALSKSSSKASLLKDEPAVKAPKSASRHAKKAERLEAERREKEAALAGSEEEDPIPVEHPPADQYGAYFADQERQLEMELGRKYKTPALALNWVENRLKTYSRQASGLASGLKDTTTTAASHAVTQARKTTAGLLKSAAKALESGLESPPELQESKSHSENHPTKHSRTDD